VSLKIALVHDWLVTWGGAENVLVDLLALFPDAEVLTLVDFMPPPLRARLGATRVTPSRLQRWPFANPHFRRYLPLFASAMRALDAGRYDVIIANSHSVAKFVRARPDQLFICYCHTPMRYAWDLRETYLTQTGLAHGVRGRLVRRVLDRLQRQDLASNATITRFVANSANVARRIARLYGRDADVIHPPVDTDRFAPGATVGNHYVTVSRLVPYKRVDVLVDAFARMPARRLIVAGAGPELAALRERATPNVEVRGHVGDDELVALVQSARAFLFAADEDFGIAPLEAQACGVPVIALDRGGVQETVGGGVPQTGELFASPTPEEVVAAVERFETRGAASREACRANAERFSRPRFRAAFATYVEQAWATFRSPT
jgi:glycosyltransferase involved in cell wall biosynthesis